MSVHLAACETSTETIELVLPSHRSSYLLYGDSTSLMLGEDAELAVIDMIEKWFAEQGLDRCVSISEEAFFSWRNDGPMTIGANCTTFTFTLAH